MKKAMYQKPECQWTEMDQDEALMLATSGGQPVVSVSDEDAGENVGGLSNSSYNIWEDDEE